jgi:probable phosphoglycerate mutase
VEGIARRHAGERVVIVAHGGVLQSLFRGAVGLALGAPRTFSLLNASINSFSVDDGRWKLEAWGDTSHLRGIDSLDDF